MRSTILFEQNNKNKIYLATLDCLKLQLKEKNMEFEYIGLDRTSVKNCKGCFGCWVKTPGECVIGDYGNKIVKNIINSDYCFIITSIRFGSYSFVMKQVIDRFIPLITPFFQFIGDEVHHKQRYEKYPHLIPIGFLPIHDQREEDLFKRIGNRNKINFFSPTGNPSVISDRDTAETIKEKITNSFN